MAGHAGVDFTHIPRDNLYATPRTPTTSGNETRSRTTFTPTSVSSTRTPSRQQHASPSAGYYSAASSARQYRSHVASNASRKRSRLTSSPSKRTSIFSPPPPTPLSGGYVRPGHVSPPPLANSRYHLATGFDTPTAAQADAYDRPLFSAEAEHTRSFPRLRDDDCDRPSYAHGLEGSDEARRLAGPLARHSNTANTIPGEVPSWSVSRALFNTVTGVAGMVFHFCTAGAFRGFTAGGGQGWAVNEGSDGAMGAPRPMASTRATEKSGLSMEDSWQEADFANIPAQSMGDVGWETVKDTTRTASRPLQSHFEPPASWPSPTGTPPTRAAKKFKSSLADDGGLRGNWILVGEQDEYGRHSSRAGSPASSSTASPAGLRRKSMAGGLNGGNLGAAASLTPRSGATGHRKSLSTSAAGSTSASPAGSSHRRRFTASVSIPLGSHGGHPVSTTATTSSTSSLSSSAAAGTHAASSAALRSSALRRSNESPALYRGDNGRRSRAGSTRSSLVGIGTDNVGNRNANGTGNGNINGTRNAADATASPLGKEGERLVRQKERREREEERELSRMNKRLEDMIRQGREALGTRYEVEELVDDDDDDGYGEEGDALMY